MLRNKARLKMDLDSIENQRRYPLALQLAPMIDIFVLIIVFLLKSTIVADVSIVFPQDIPPPISKSKENLETSPEVVLTEKELIISNIEETISVEQIDKISQDKIDNLKARVENYIKTKDEKVRLQAMNANLITFRNNNYKNVFKAVRFLRLIGFHNVAFIASGEG